MNNYKIAEARTAKGWSQSEFAKRLGTTQQQVARYECGENDVKSSIIIKMSSVLGVTISYLLGLDSPSPDEGLSANETELIGLYRRMEPEQQAVIISTARTFAYAAKNNGRTALRTEGMAGVKA